jgi:hypothetical protein
LGFSSSRANPVLSKVSVGRFADFSAIALERLPAVVHDARMPLVPRREDFGHPEHLSLAWSLMDSKTAACEVWSHVLGFELRALVSDELIQSQVCRSQDELVRVQEEWRTAFEASGWSR